MNVFLTASNSCYREVCNYCAYCAKRHGGFEKIIVYDIDSDIDDDYKRQYADILGTKKGAGLWLWKVFFIDKALREECEEGDTLFYADAASFFFRSARPILTQMKDDFFAVNLPYVEEEFTKRETFELMGLTTDEYTKTRQFHASFMAFRKSEKSVSFVSEWKKRCEDIRLISQDIYYGEQIPNFISHRFDQSIFSLLCKKYGVQPSEDPSVHGITGYCKYGEASYLSLPMTEAYPICMMLHKRSKWNNKEKIKWWLKIYKNLLIQALK